MRRSCGLIGTLVIALSSLSPAVRAGDDEKVGFRFQYAAKFTCGLVPPGERNIQGSTPRPSQSTTHKGRT